MDVAKHVITAATLDAIAHQIAESSTRSDIECHCVEVDVPPEGAPPARRWYDTTRLEVLEDEREFIDDAVRYLEARGLLLRREGATHIVSFLNRESISA